MEEEDGKERSDGDQDMDSARQGAPSDPQDCFQDQRYHHRLEPGEHAPDGLAVSVHRINVGKPEQNKNGGRNKQDPGDKAAAHAMHQPSDVGGQLLRLRSRK